MLNYTGRNAQRTVLLVVAWTLERKFHNENNKLLVNIHCIYLNNHFKCKFWRDKSNWMLKSGFWDSIDFNVSSWNSIHWPTDDSLIVVWNYIFKKIFNSIELNSFQGLKMMALLWWHFLLQFFLSYENSIEKQRYLYHEIREKISVTAPLYLYCILCAMEWSVELNASRCDQFKRMYWTFRFAMDSFPLYDESIHMFMHIWKLFTVQFER